MGGFKLAELYADITTRDGKFRQSMGRVHTALQRAQASMKKVADAAKRMLMIGGAAIGALVALYMKQGEAERLLDAALKVTGAEVDKHSDRLRKFAAELQRTTVYGDEFVMGIMRSGMMLGATADNIEEVTKNAIGLATALGMDLKTAMRYMVLAEQGEMTMLRRYIPALRSATEATEQLAIVKRTAAQGFAMAGEEAKTAAGKFKQWKNEMGDLGETVGGAFAVIAMEVLGGVKAILLPIAAWIERNKKLVESMTKVGLVVAGVLIILPKLIGLVKVLFAVLAGTNPLILLAAAIGTVVAVMINMRDETGKLDDAIGKSVNTLKDKHVVHLQEFRTLERLLSLQTRTNEEQRSANELAKKLTKSYGDLGITYNEAGDAISLMDGALQRLQATMKAQMISQLDVEIAKASAQADRLERRYSEFFEKAKTLRGKYSGTMREVFSGRFRWAEEVMKEDYFRPYEEAAAMLQTLIDKKADLMGATEYDPTKAGAATRAKHAMKIGAKWRSVEQEITRSYMDEYAKRKDILLEEYENRKKLAMETFKENATREEALTKLTAWHASERSKIEKEELEAQQREKEVVKKAEEKKAKPPTFQPAMGFTSVLGLARSLQERVLKKQLELTKEGVVQAKKQTVLLGEIKRELKDRDPSLALN